jgi:hypothetical protein
MSEFRNWINTFLQEKGRSLQDRVEVEHQGKTHNIGLGTVVEFLMFGVSSRDQQRIMEEVAQLDFKNVDTDDIIGQMAKWSLEAKEPRPMRRVGYAIPIQPGDGTYYNTFYLFNGVVGVHSGDTGYGPISSPQSRGISNRFNPYTSKLLEALVEVSDNNMKPQSLLPAWENAIADYRNYYRAQTGRIGSPDTFPAKDGVIELVSADPSLGCFYKGRGGDYLAAFTPIGRPVGVVGIPVVGMSKYDIKYSIRNTYSGAGLSPDDINLLLVRLRAKEALKRLK